MPKQSFSCIAALLAIAVLVSGCSGWSSWPWPRIVENTDGLGTSPMGDFLREVSWESTEDGMTRHVAKFINEQTTANGISRKDAESLGMQCAPAPSTECRYSGEMWSRIERIPPEAPHYGKRTIKNIDVRFSYLKPQSLVVHVRLHDIPDE